MNQKGEDDEDLNSIISEEDSAFEDQTPNFHLPKKANVQKQMQRYNAANGKEFQVEYVDKMNGSTETLKKFKRQKTVGWKN